MWGYTLFTKRREINYNSGQEGDDPKEEHERNKNVSSASILHQEKIIRQITSETAVLSLVLVLICTI